MPGLLIVQRLGKAHVHAFRVGTRIEIALDGSILVSEPAINGSAALATSFAAPELWPIEEARPAVPHAPMRLRDQLLTVSEAYSSAVGRSEGRVSTLVFGSGNALSRVREGADMTSERIHDALQWFSNHWPDAVDWPEGIERPARAEPAPPAPTKPKRKAAA